MIDAQLADWTQLLDGVPTLRRTGRVVQAKGNMLKATGLAGKIGDICDIMAPDGRLVLQGEITGLEGPVSLLCPLGSLRKLPQDAQAVIRPGFERIPTGDPVLGRVLDAFGRPLDGKGALPPRAVSAPLLAEPPNPMDRRGITEILETGIAAIDMLLSIGVGQRLGLFAAAGVGKSSLLGMLARHAHCDRIVIGLVGERGREVREFIEDVLGAKGLANATLVVATADRPAVERLRAAQAATAIAEGFRREGRSVLLLLDSVTRVARAIREIGLSIGEPPVRRGFPPSVFAELPRLFERAGNDDMGCMTAIYTVLMEDEDMADPIAEEVRSLLDGHIMLSRNLAQEGHFPAIDILSSASRLFQRLVQPDHYQAAMAVRKNLARYEEVKLLVQMGEYKAGTDEATDQALERHPQIRAFLAQGQGECRSMADSLNRLSKLVA